MVEKKIKILFQSGGARSVGGSSADSVRSSSTGSVGKNGVLII